MLNLHTEVSVMKKMRRKDDKDQNMNWIRLRY